MRKETELTPKQEAVLESYIVEQLHKERPDNEFTAVLTRIDQHVYEVTLSHSDGRVKRWYVMHTWLREGVRKVSTGRTVFDVDLGHE